MENHLPIIFARMLSLCLYQGVHELGEETNNVERVGKEQIELIAHQQWNKFFSAFCEHEETIPDEIVHIYEQMTIYLREIFQDHLPEDSQCK